MPIDADSDTHQSNIEDIKKFWLAPRIVLLANEKNIHSGGSAAPENTSGAGGIWSAS